MLNSNPIINMIVSLDDINNYNDELHMVRIKYNNKKYDIKLGGNIYERPNSKKHLVLICCPESFFRTEELSEEQLKYIPGYTNNGNPAFINASVIGYLTNKMQKITTSLPFDAQSSFSINNTVMDEENTSIAITPPVDANYTNNTSADKQSLNIGLFINDDSIVIKTRGGQITMGNEGIHIAGQIHWGSTSHNKEIVTNNPLSIFIGSTIPTYIVGMKEIPNLVKFQSIGQAAYNFSSIVNKVSNIGNILT